MNDFIEVIQGNTGLEQRQLNFCSTFATELRNDTSKEVWLRLQLSFPSGPAGAFFRPCKYSFHS